eukprot:m51a1_g14204 putative 1-phosphatidylinositol-4-phosphate 5-kinase protein (387) ;mRNA; r:146463-147942
MRIDRSVVAALSSAGSSAQPPQPQPQPSPAALAGVQTCKEVDARHPLHATAEAVAAWVRASVRLARAGARRGAEFSARERVDAGGPDAVVEDYAPAAFSSLRTASNIDEDAYLGSFDRCLLEMRSRGRSGSFFLMSSDYRYIVKSVKDEEHDALCAILEDYCKHLISSRESLLVRFYGMATITLLPYPRTTFHVVVMENILPPPTCFLNERYDLKGSTYQREASVGELLKPDRVLKDNDFLQTRQCIALEPRRRAALLRVLCSDSSFLERHCLMDYSMLVGIRKMTQWEAALSAPEPRARQCVALTESPSPFRRDEGGFATSDSVCRGGEVLYVGLIDYLQPYNTRKQVECALKFVTTGGKDISVTDPVSYGKRFRAFVQQILKDA